MKLSFHRRCNIAICASQKCPDVIVKTYDFRPRLCR